VALVVNIALNVALIPLYGIRGAAIAWAVAIVVRNLLPLFQVRRHLGMWPATSAGVRVALAAVVCFGVVDVVAAVGDLPLAVDVALLGVGTLAYASVIWSWRATLGLGAFRSALRRRPGASSPRLPAGV
jgi:peptidoglycan biosynthesis protein MviN/MurJ (putative lipid II flippase)